MSSQRDQTAGELLTAALRQSGVAVSEQDRRRLADELAGLLDEGAIISKAVPTSLEPQIRIVLEDAADAS